MAALTHLTTRPGPGADSAARSHHRRIGITLAVTGLIGAAVAAIGNFAAAGGIDTTNSYQETLAWTFGVSIFSFGVIKLAIAVMLIGILVRLWFRVDAVTASLETCTATVEPHLRPARRRPHGDPLGSPTHLPVCSRSTGWPGACGCRCW